MATKKQVEARPIPLADALVTIEMIEEMIDGGMTPADAIFRITGERGMKLDAAAGFTAAIDRYVAVEFGFKAKEDLLEDLYQKAKKRRDSVKNAHTKFKEYLRQLMRAHPDKVFNGHEHGFVEQVNGGVAKMELKFSTYELRDLVELIDIHAYDIPADCYDRLEVHRLNKTKLRHYMDTSGEKHQTEVIDADGDQIIGTSRFGLLKRGKSLRLK